MCLKVSVAVGKHHGHKQLEEETVFGFQSEKRLQTMTEESQGRSRYRSHESVLPTGLPAILKNWARPTQINP